MSTRAGITPACAGKSTCFVVIGGLNKDHPRMCGEKCYWGPLTQNFSGSPPHVRGKEFLHILIP